MRVTVDFDRCESHGLCVYAAPEVFRMDAADNLDYDGSPDSAHDDAVRDAAAGCPTAAIRVEAH